MAERIVSRSRDIDASPEAIFAVVASPSGHVRIDGSNSVQAVISGDDRLEMGSKFRMNMKLGVPYKMSSTVVEFEENRLIAWAHFGKHRWRFELEPVEVGTKVTHSFDWSTAVIPKLIELAGYPKRHPGNLERTLERLDKLLTSES